MRLGLTLLASALLGLVAFETSSASASGDLPLVEAVRNRNRSAVLSLLDGATDVNTPQADGATALAWAAHWDDIEIAELLIRAGANINAANDYGVTPLSLACLNRNDKLVEALLRGGARTEAAQWTGETPLMTCARTGAIGAVRTLLDHGANVNAQTRRGQTALMWAVAQKRADVARLLIARGADVNAKSHRFPNVQPRFHLSYAMHDYVPGTPERFDADDVHEAPDTSKGGFTPLMFAARVGDIESTRVLLEAGANVDDFSPEYGTALVVAAANGHETLAEFLLQRGADTNLADGYGLTALHYTLREGLTVIGMARPGVPTDPVWLRPSMPQLAASLLDRGADSNAPIGKGLPAYSYPPFARADANSGNIPRLRQPGATPLFLASAAADIDLMQRLLRAGADPLRATEEGTTPLMAAAGLGRYEDYSNNEEKRALEATQLLVEFGADVNQVNHHGETALHAAVHRGANSIVRFLVEKGADLEKKDKYGRTPLIVAQGDPDRLVDPKDKRFRRTRGHESTTDLLLESGAIPSSTSTRSGPANP